MKHTTFNIGLNNNPFNYEKVVAIITNSLGHDGAKVEAQLRDGVYETEVEPTAVIRIGHRAFSYQDSKWADSVTDALCSAFEQECIPYRHVDASVVSERLVYNKTFKGDKYDFDGAYFIEYSDKD